MEKDNLKDNETNTDSKEIESIDNSESKQNTNEKEENINVNEEVESLIEDKDTQEEKKSSNTILANIIDQGIMVAISAILIVLIDLILRIFGYMFVRGNGSIILAIGIIYFIINCIYVPMIQKCKGKTTIGKKILNVN